MCKQTIFVVTGEGYPFDYGSETLLLGVFEKYPTEDQLWHTKEKVWEYILENHDGEISIMEEEEAAKYSIETMKVTVTETVLDEVVDFDLGGYIE